MNTTRLLVIGAGAIGRTHIDRIHRTPGLALAGIADPSDAGRALAESLDVPWTPDHLSALERLQPQGAIVATPNPQHVPMALDCLARGVAALVEKPLADSVTEAQQLVDAQKACGVPVLVGHHRRHNPINRQARETIASGRLGRIVGANAMACFYKPQGYFAMAWRREPGGGPVLINLIHEIDMLRFLCGEIVQVQALSSNAVRGYPVEDTAAALLRFENGALGTVLLSDTAVSPWCWDMCAGEQDQYPRQDANALFIAGTHGSLSLPDLSLWHYEGERHWHQPLTREQTATSKADTYTRQLLHFAAVIRGDEAALCSALDGLRTLQATRALLDAAASGQSVTCSVSTS
ncbi:Gfo/Idh/MocA family protein [Hydrogenophaga sp. RWCD_12]|uniref:Gfo/Idh/MocA family protein n=1 Tax=Hydrogenophaga sp. RWCD_12 TaxID=3391190 RepID=UPI00398480C4